ncbi:MAG: hypothetical protein NC040_06500 [Muribaculaceae bacterium]|nr:hypothetical protein [Alistipes senegalensis]MCM1473689.1 hypothetical protein [Muribaculaceae bacterium]
MKKKKHIVIPLILVAFVVGFLIFDSNRPHAGFSRNWDIIAEQFEIVNDYAMAKFPNERNYIELSDLDDTNDENINNALSAIREYLNKYFDNGSYIQVVDKGDAVEYTCMERHQYILVHINSNEKKVLKYYRKLKLSRTKYIIDKLGNDWYLVFQHHI